jgi:hypothetical protein
MTNSSLASRWRRKIALQFCRQAAPPDHYMT